MTTRKPIDPRAYAPNLCWTTLRGTDRFCTEQPHKTGDHHHEYTGITWPPEQSETR